MSPAWQQEWFSNVKSDILAGTVVALALIPEAIAFSIIAGLDPKVGLYASFCIAIVTAFVGGQPGLIKLGRQMKYIPRSVMLGFVNALAILIFMAQLPQLTNVPMTVYIMVAIALAIIYLLPRLTKALPSPLTDSARPDNV